MSMNSSPDRRSQYPPLSLSWLIWGLAACLYLYAFFQRVAPAVITDELSQAFSLTATSLGNLSAFYFYSYVAMQIPTGILADIWGPRKILTAGALGAGIGSLLFAVATDFTLASFGRLLIGGSVAVTFVSMLKLAHHWLPAKQFAFASGIALFVGIVGAVFAGVPLHLLVESFGWRNVMAVAAIIPLLLGLLVWTMVRDDPRDRQYRSYVEQQPKTVQSPWQQAWNGLKQVLTFRNTWLLSLVPGGIVGSILAFAGLWGVPFLSTHHNLTTSEAAAVCSAMLIAWAFAGPLFGWVSDRLGNRKNLYTAGCAVVALGWGLVVFNPGLQRELLIPLLLLIGVASGCMIVGFAFAKESVPAHLAGTVSGVVNMGVMSGPMLLQPAVGWILDQNHAIDSISTPKMYSLDAYASGFLLMAAWALLSLLLIVFTREPQKQPSTT